VQCRRERTARENAPQQPRALIVKVRDAVAEIDGQVRLSIKINEKAAITRAGELATQVRRDRGLPDPPLSLTIAMTRPNA
jgi:hypothetical protein